MGVSEILRIPGIYFGIVEEGIGDPKR